MYEYRRGDDSARFPMPIPGVPDAQARALDRRQRLDQQQRGFRATYARPIEPSDGRDAVAPED
jgi:hypothetical protein